MNSILVPIGMGVASLGSDRSNTFVPSLPATSPYLNWFMNLVYQWCVYLDAIEGRSSRQEMFTALGKQIPTFKDPVALANVVFPGFDPDGYLHLPTIVDSIDWYSSRGLLQQKPKLADLVDYQYIEYALKRLGRKGPAQPGPK